jgi:hypothetical protein
MKFEGQLLPDHAHIAEVRSSGPETEARVVATRDHDVIRRWATARSAEPATGEATSTGPATVDVKDGGAGIRFNFPAVGVFRPISWDEWFANFDRHLCAFVYEADDPSGTRSNRYRIVRASEWKDLLA